MNRRQFINQTLAMTGLGLSWKTWAIPNSSSSPRLLVVMLRGAYDGASLLVPHGYPFYYAARPNIALAQPNPANPDAALDIGHGYGLHPAVASSLHTMFQAQQAVLVPFSGSQDLSRSHFQSQDVMELGQNSSHALDYSSGFLYRLVALLRQGGRNLNGMSFTSNITPIFKGVAEIPNINLQGQVNAMADPRQTSMLEALYQGQAMQMYVDEGIQTRQQVSALLDKEMKDASRGAAKASGFEKVARSMAALMRDNPAYAVGFVDVGGWDTHVNQGASNGVLANNLGNLGRGLSSYADELGVDAWRNTTVVVMSEFGRTFRENGNRGTDHGHGNTMWILGGSVSGGKLAGELMDINEATLFQQRDLPVFNDYRSVLGNILSRMYGLNTRQLNEVLPGALIKDFGIC
ncbi:hypothetical protein SFSGTM_15200 [Sulfuriferula nivalis]|uniref:DUF1501 domain-containing protein n=2 Tax=Sulfuriferula nivalis TaxID=2675298 RepID=A0A809S9B8_9PROT|nr:hypothetical protein SFSGTM_15200 [Sulfuriferula nivalis]